MNKKGREYWVVFNMIPGIGREKFNQLEKYFGSLENAWKAGAGELRHAGLDRKCEGYNGMALQDFQAIGDG